MGKAGMLRGSGISGMASALGSMGGTAGIEVKEVIEVTEFMEVTEEPRGMGVSIGIAGMTDRLGIDPIPANPANFFLNHTFFLYIIYIYLYISRIYDTLFSQQTVLRRLLQHFIQPLEVYISVYTACTA